MPLTLVPAAAPAPAKTAPAGPRSWVERYEDEHGEFYVAHCTCTWASPERADPGEAETARALHDDTHLPPGHPDHSLFRLDTVAADDPEAFDDLDEGGEP